VATDGAGIRQVLAAYEKAVQKNMHIAAGTQRRHQAGYIETIKRLHEGAVGDPVLLRVYWDGSGIWFHRRDELKNFQEAPTDLAYQLLNWYHFRWICGDHIVEQHVHNLDVANWVMNDHPVRAWGMGSRIGHSAARPDGDPKDVGNIFDNFAVQFEYPNGTRMISECRQIPGCWDSVSEAAHGTKGTSQINSYIINKERVGGRGERNPYEQEHTDLIAAIRGNKPLNELKNVAESTMTAIFGREAAYSGKAVTWDQVLGMKQLMDTTSLRWDSDVPVPPVPIPGKHKFA
jgi:predicted dehydrogenase